MSRISSTHQQQESNRSGSELNQEQKRVDTEIVPSYGLLVINHAYNEGKLTFQEWIELSREWALKTIAQHKRRAA